MLRVLKIASYLLNSVVCLQFGSERFKEYLEFEQVFYILHISHWDFEERSHLYENIDTNKSSFIFKLSSSTILRFFPSCMKFFWIPTIVKVRLKFLTFAHHF